MEFSLHLLDEVVLDLEHHEQSRRIKKLFFCISKDRWENDSNVLERFALKDLIRETIQAKDLENISLSLNEIVESLNRQEVYAAIANDIIETLSKLNTSEEEATQILVRPKKKIPPKQIIPGIYLNKMVGYIENNRESNRLKKLIFSAFKNRWESDLNTIESHELKDLILQLRQNYPTIEALKQTLYDLVESLNRKEVYSLLADSIVNQLEITYQQVNNNPEEETYLMTQMIDTKEVEAVRQAANYARERDSFASGEIEKANNKGELIFNPPENNELEPIESISSEGTYDLFELRLKIIQYTNPLRAKNILYSTIYGQNFEDREQCLSVLKNYTLDELLSRLFYKYKNLEQIEDNLALTARETLDPDANLQAVNAIIESIKPIY